MIDKIALFHPLLFSFVFVISPYTQYAGLIPPMQIVVPFILICVFTIFLYFIIKRIVTKANLAVAILAPMLILFFYYGTLYEYISSLTRGTKLRIPVLILANLLILIILVIFIVKVFRWHEGAIKKTNRIFFVIAASIIVFNTFSIIKQYIVSPKLNASLGMPGISKQNHTEYFPDIYFIILDEYAAPSQMKSYFQYDMSPFIEYIKGKGFIVTEIRDESLATGDIMESRLNMEIINHKDDMASSKSILNRLFESMGLRNSYEKGQMIRIRNSKVIKYLNSIGYQFINIGSWFYQTRYNKLAVQNINCFGFQFKDELSTIIVNNTVLRLILIKRYFHRRAVIRAFDVLENMPIISGKAKFIFAHIICPHTPYVFGANGEKLGLNPEKSNDNKHLYLDQHIFITKKVKELIDQIHSSSQASSVIIIQADHGFRIDKPQADKVFSAVYIPSKKRTPWPDSISSSNTFRILFNDLFGSKYEILQ